MPAKIRPVTQKMKDAIGKAAGALAIDAPDISDGAGKAYEAWVLLEVAVALKKAGLGVVARDHTGAATKAFRVSGGPHFIPPAASRDPDEPCHFELTSKDYEYEYELDAGVRHFGNSGDDHELDISVLAKIDVDAVRATGGPAQGHAWLGIELKEYDAAGHLDKVFSRALLGTAVDLDPGFLMRSVTVEFPHHRYTMGRPWPQRNYWLATTAKLRPGHAAFLKSYGIEARGSVSPEVPGHLVSMAVKTLTEQLW